MHWLGFHNLLWKQTKKDSDELKKKRRKELEAKKPINLHNCNRCDTEVYSSKNNYKCPKCNVQMKIFEGSLTNFHCIKCLKTWLGVIYQDICTECIFGSTSKCPTETVCDKCKETKEIISVNVFWEYGYLL